MKSGFLGKMNNSNNIKTYLSNDPLEFVCMNYQHFEIGGICPKCKDKTQEEVIKETVRHPKLNGLFFAE